MKGRIKISDFAKLTGSTLKTVIYYHKIGLLQEPDRSPGGYRLYGPAELSRMRLIKRLKLLGLDLKNIREILGDKHNHKTLREVLKSLQAELLNEKKSLEERVAKIEMLLCENKEYEVLLDEDVLDSTSFQMITEILGQDKIHKYARTCPEILNQQQKLFDILDNFKWGEDYQEIFRGLAEYFQEHPQQYQIALDFGARLAKLDNLSEDASEIETLARETAEFIKSIPQLRELLCNQPGIKKPLKSLYNEMVAGVLSPARMKHSQLLRQYLDLPT
ncbi:MerR family transcriptional regulator [Phosphitispora sp. TUW77]|uniref:helix-turn-helix domain-containing protein n=1 Tax=Phosphitispora sp. TUW77 TaxID=3152361 RepID=UPI003AB88425